jgi:glyoxylase-like metal-dependent hydrolase (beta-lactamase superfamily II)
MELDQINSWLWRLHTPVVQAYAVRERDGFNLIDTSTAGEEGAILELLATLERETPDGVRVYDILLTHGHDDHVGSAAALADRTGGRVIASREEAAAIRGDRTAPPPVLSDWEIPLFNEVTATVPRARSLVPDRLVVDLEQLGWQRDATVVATPGHTPGHISVWFDRDRVLVAGDALASYDGRPIVGVFNSDPRAATSSARHLATLDAEVVCFGHGEPLRQDAAALLSDVFDGSQAKEELQ